MDYINCSMLFNLPEPLSKEEISEYFSQYRSGKMNAREKLILYNMRLVYYVAYKYKNAGYEIEDLFSIGLIMRFTFHTSQFIVTSLLCTQTAHSASPRPRCPHCQRQLPPQ